ncbi:enoyl-CoA hydratase/isomerase family protein [Streptomyces muensis]|uniref:Enoyl-CoA hydratase/isomerase family protein n=1 Tax=Streptomyces muensis TaxID=1077944 RepID=A0A9X1PU71_STRM4|nr:enoyl-CoA hydratase/isomerase family protein [Streptomyces muensis]MCF1592334.1 enoyl-CoA hydratase/isomerase family protein [Streptomyces muensis]
MYAAPISTTHLAELLADPTGVSELVRDNSPLVVVDLDSGPLTSRPETMTPLVVVGVTTAASPGEHSHAAACDAVLDKDDAGLESMAGTVARAPGASTVLAQLLRGTSTRSVDDGLFVESLAYSTLLMGPEFARWRATTPPRSRPSEAGSAVVLERSGHRLDIRLNRPHVRNALNAAMRDALVDAFRLAALDTSVSEVYLSGAGPTYSAGGDLDEFGTFENAVQAHLVRLQQSVGRAVHQIRDRVTVFLHGACYGSGVEIPAFAGRIVADPGTRIALPELSLGLIPGAGGTVSIPRRIGRHRTAELALTGTPMTAQDALACGLIDAVEPRQSV